MGAHQQQPAGPGDGNVGEPVLAAALLHGERLGETSHRLVVDVTQLRQRVRVAAQRIGQRRGAAQPVPGHPVGREHVGRQPRHEHHVPLQALRLVHGEDLHRVGRGDHRLFQPGAVLAFGLQVGEQPGEGGVGVDVGVVGHGLGERGQGGAAARVQRLQLDRHAEHRDHPLHQLGDRVPGVTAQQAQLGGEHREPTPRVGVVGPPSRVGQRLQQAGHRGRIGAHQRLQPVAGLIAGRRPRTGVPVVGQFPGAAPQQRQVGDPDRPSR